MHIQLFLKSICDILLEEGSCLSDGDKFFINRFFYHYLSNKEINSISHLLRDIYIDAINMEKVANIDMKVSAYVLAVKQGLLKEKQDGTYTPIFEAGKKGLINVLHRWHDLLEENEIPMPTYEDIANKVRKENGEAYNKNSIRNYLSRVGSLE